MATTTPGYSFAPTFENAELGRRGGSPAEFPQGSIKVLNFRLPRIAGAPGPNAISPLVGDRPSGGFGSAVLQSVLHTVLGPEAAAALTSALPSAGSAGASRSGTRDPGSAILDRFAPRPATSPGAGPDFETPGTPPAPRPPAPKTPPNIGAGQQTGEGPSQEIDLPGNFRPPTRDLSDEPAPSFSDSYVGRSRDFPSGRVYRD